MEISPIVEIGAAAMVAGYIVALVKHAHSEILSWQLVVAAVASGIFSAFLVALSEGVVLNSQSVAQTLIQGIAAAIVAAGLTRTDNSAEAKRPDSELR